MALCASEQEMDHIAGAVNSASGKDGAVGFFFLLLTLLGVHRLSASRSAC